MMNERISIFRPGADVDPQLHTYQPVFENIPASIEFFEADDRVRERLDSAETRYHVMIRNLRDDNGRIPQIPKQSRIEWLTRTRADGAHVMLSVKDAAEPGERDVNRQLTAVVST